MPRLEESFQANEISAMFFVFVFKGWRPLLYVTFCIYLVRETLFLSTKGHRMSQGILKAGVCGNRENVLIM